MNTYVLIFYIEKSVKPNPVLHLTMQAGSFDIVDLVLFSLLLPESKPERIRV
jgi:hypothetical protein